MCETPHANIEVMSSTVCSNESPGTRNVSLISVLLSVSYIGLQIGSWLGQREREGNDI